jgi:hypothetical protein
LHLHRASTGVKFIETEVRTVAWELGGRLHYFMGTALQFCQIEKALEMGGGDGCTTQLNTLNIAKVVNFTMHYGPP